MAPTRKRPAPPDDPPDKPNKSRSRAVTREECTEQHRTQQQVPQDCLFCEDNARGWAPDDPAPTPLSQIILAERLPDVPHIHTEGSPNYPFPLSYLDEMESPPPPLFPPPPPPATPPPRETTVTRDEPRPTQTLAAQEDNATPTNPPNNQQRVLQPARTPTPVGTQQDSLLDRGSPLPRDSPLRRTQTLSPAVIYHRRAREPRKTSFPATDGQQPAPWRLQREALQQEGLKQGALQQEGVQQGALQQGFLQQGSLQRGSLQQDGFQPGGHQPIANRRGLFIDADSPILPGALSRPRYNQHHTSQPQPVSYVNRHSPMAPMAMDPALPPAAYVTHDLSPFPYPAEFRGAPAPPFGSYPMPPAAYTTHHRQPVHMPGPASNRPASGLLTTTYLNPRQQPFHAPQPAPNRQAPALRPAAYTTHGQQRPYTPRPSTNQWGSAPPTAADSPPRQQPLPSFTTINQPLTRQHPTQAPNHAGTNNTPTLPSSSAASTIQNASHDPKKPFVCEHCSNPYQSKHSLRRHQREKHIKNVNRHSKE